MLAVDHFGDVGNLSAATLALIGVITALGAALAFFVDYRIGKRLAPILERLLAVEHEVTTNGGVTRGHDGTVDGTLTTTKDLTVNNAGQLDEIQRMLRTLLRTNEDVEQRRVDNNETRP